jgi:5-methylcytosine-specific restriction protein A
MKNPQWDREEVVLLIELYIKICDSRVNKNNPAILNLSQKLNDRALRSGINIKTTFRSNIGIFMKLKNIEFLDSNGKRGLSGYSKLDAIVWKEFVDKIIK